MHRSHFDSLFNLALSNQPVDPLTYDSVGHETKRWTVSYYPATISDWGEQFFLIMRLYTIYKNTNFYIGSLLRARTHWPLCLATGGRVFVADPSKLGRHVGDFTRATSLLCSKRSVCGGDEPQPVAHLSYKLQCAHQSLKIMVSYGNKYLCHKNTATCG